MSRESLESIFEGVRDGLYSIRYAAALLGWTVEDICEAVFGEIVL